MNLSDGEVDVDMEFPWSDMGYSGGESRWCVQLSSSLSSYLSSFQRRRRSYKLRSQELFSDNIVTSNFRFIIKDFIDDRII
jgi:hypothetical protein